MKTSYKLVTEFLSKKISLLFILLCLFSINESRASHATGADLTYQFLGNGVYRVTFTFYRDCFGIDAPTQQTLNVNSTTCNYSQSFTMNPVPNTGVENCQSTH